MDILNDMGVSKISAKVFFSKVNYSFKAILIYISRDWNCWFKFSVVKGKSHSHPNATFQISINITTRLPPNTCSAVTRHALYYTTKHVVCVGRGGFY